MCNEPKEHTKPQHEINRDVRRTLLDELELKHGMFINALDNFQGKGNQDIPLAELKKFNYMEWVYLNDKVKFRRRKSIGEYFMFDCVLEKGGEFGMHLHSDCQEYTEVIKGKLVDIQTNDEYLEGDIAFWDKKVKHIPIALEDTILRVFFK